jgi:DNA-binding response OmpR family regulator
MCQGIDAGAARYLTKPCNPRQLIKIIKEEIAKAEESLNK